MENYYVKSLSWKSSDIGPMAYGMINMNCYTLINTQNAI